MRKPCAPKPPSPTTTVRIDAVVGSRIFTRASPGAESFAGFVRSIEQTGGPVQPPLVRPCGSGRYEIIAGHHRWQAALEAKQKMLTVTVIKADDRKAVLLMLIENLQRFESNAVDQAELLWIAAQKLHDAAAAPAGGSTLPHRLSERKAADLLAPHLGKKPETIRHMLCVLPSAPENRERLRAAGVTFHHCREARRLIGQTAIPDASQEKFWVDLVLEAVRKGWTVRQMVKVGRARYPMRDRKQLGIIPGTRLTAEEPPARMYNICDECGQPWGAHLCPSRERDAAAVDAWLRRHGFARDPDAADRGAATPPGKTPEPKGERKPPRTS